MSTTYVLILLTFLSRTSLATQEFTSEQRCKDAGAAFTTALQRDHVTPATDITFICVPK
jgi:hypothetical protein